MSKIIEIRTLKELYEMSSMGGGMVQGYAKKEDDKMKREDIVTEEKLRKYIRNKITESYKQKRTQQLNEEAKLREVIRSILKESDISDIHPHRSTGINVLEDLLKKMIPTLRTDYKRLTTSKEQRDSFRAHIVNAIKKSLLPSLVNDKFVQGDSVDPGMLMVEPGDDAEVDAPPEPELDAEDGDELAPDIEDELLEQEIEVAIEDDPDPTKKVDAGLEDDKPNEEEEFGSGIEDQGFDETGRNMAFTCFKKVQQYILDSYDLLRDPKDKKVFVDYLITNTKLYLDKFEDELQNTVEEPTTPEYENTKGV
jgi:hypothetical protein